MFLLFKLVVAIGSTPGTSGSLWIGALGSESLRFSSKFELSTQIGVRNIPRASSFVQPGPLSVCQNSEFKACLPCGLLQLSICFIANVYISNVQLKNVRLAAVLSTCLVSCYEQHFVIILYKHNKTGFIDFVVSG